MSPRRSAVKREKWTGLSRRDGRAALRRLSARRSSSERPPQTPASCPDSSAHFRQVSMTSQRRHTALASSICRIAGPVFPIGKNSSGSSSRQAARSRQSMLIVLLDEAVGAVRTGTGPVVGREWLRGRSQWREWWRVGGPGGVGWRWSSSSVSSVRMSRQSSGSGEWRSWPGRTSTSAFHRWCGRLRWSLGAGGEVAALLPRRCRVGSDLDHTASAPRATPADAPMFQGRRTV